MTKGLIPLLKWAGGKRWFVDRYRHVFPKTYGHYFEPFLGSAATFFSLNPVSATLADLNAELIETYKAIRDDYAKVWKRLKEHQRLHSEGHYYKVRQSRPRSLPARAARFIYLNRTCWNGLYRVNRRGEFNVPKGTKENVLLETDDFEALGKRLANVSLIVSDFEQIISDAGEGDLVFADPPYTVRHNYNGFLKYNERIFSWDDQVRLRNALMSAKERGVQVVATNAYHPSVVELYRSDFVVQPLRRSSVIAADSAFRGDYEELLVTSFEIDEARFRGAERKDNVLAVR